MIVYLHYDPETGKADDAASSVPTEAPCITLELDAWTQAAESGLDAYVVDGTLQLREPARNILDYDMAIEEHLKAERCARGYTVREPDFYINSSVPRWKQDALDWIAHRDEVLLHALEVENSYAAGGDAPTLAEFRESLPSIEWTYEEGETL